MTPFVLALVTFISLALLAAGAAALLSQRGDAVKTRLRALTAGADGGMGNVSVLADDKPRNPFERLLFKLGHRKEAAAESGGDDGPVRRRPKADMRTLLVQAGIRRPNALQLLMGVRVAVAVITLLIGMMVATVVNPTLMPASFVFAVTAYMLPGFLVARMAAARRFEVKRSLPDALDLLLLSVEAGLGLNAAMLRVAEERTSTGSDALGDELLILTKELQVGMPRRDALRNLADRTGVDEVRALSAQLIQSERLGSSIGAALRAMSQHIRTQRKLEAEEQANKTQIKLLFPLILFIFPSVMIVILMPAVIRLIEALQSVM